MGSGYFVASVSQAAELSVAAAVCQLGFRAYAPRFRIRESVRGRIVRRAEMLFPGYVFVGWTRSFHAILGVRGVSEILGLRDGSRPGRVPHEDIRRIRDLEDEHGYVVIPHEPASVVRPSFRSGDLVRVGTGPMSGHVGTFEKSLSLEEAVVNLRMGDATVRARVSRRSLLAA